MSGTTVELIRDLEATRDETLACFALGEKELSLAYGPGKWSIRTMGVRTLRQEFEKVAEHNAHHSAHIRAALARGDLGTIGREDGSR